MEIIALPDIHGRLALLDKIEAKVQKADLVVVPGDITNFGNIHTAQNILERIKTLNPKIFVVTGNCDPPDIEESLLREGLSVHGTVKTTGGLDVAGIGGSLHCPGPTPNERDDEDFEDIIQDIENQRSGENPFILVCHHPPFGTLNDQIAGGEHVGSHSVRQYIEKTQPLVCFTGHIHEGKGISTIGKTKVVNPSPFFSGGYALAKIEKGTAEVEIQSALA